jgi:hypothetical protein
MNMKNYFKGKDHIVTKAMLAVSIFLGLMILTKTGTAFGQFIKWKSEVKKAAAAMTVSPKQSEQSLAAAKTIVDNMKKKNLFAPQPAKAKSIEQVAGIFGDEALINGKWYKAAAKVQDAEIVSIEPTKVVVRVDGQEKSFLPIISKSSETSGEKGQDGSQSESSRHFDGSPRFDHGDHGPGGGGFQMPSREEIEKIRAMPEEERRAYIRDRFQRYRDSRHNN